MTGEEAKAILDDVLDKLAEHFDAVQIHASWMDSGAETASVHRGSGNFYARESLSREFVSQNKAQDQAHELAKVLEPPDDWNQNV
jgi:hypothetical protein